MALEPPGDHFVDRGDVALPGRAPDREPAVLALAGEAVLEHHHRGHDVVTHQVGHVVALDAQRRLVEIKSVGDLLQGPAAGGEIARPAQLVLGQGLFGVALDGLHQRLLVAALGNPHLDPRPPLLGEQLGDGVDLGREGRHQDLARHRLGRGLAVHLQQEVLHQLARGGLLHLVDDPAALAADAASAHVEDLDGGLQRVFGERDHVTVGALTEHHGLLLEGTLERLDVVAEPRGPLVLLGGGGLAHVALEPLDETGGVARHEVAEVLSEPAVLILGHPADARGGALVDIAQQARPPDLPGALEHPRRAGAHGEHPEQKIDGLADRPGVGVGPEVAGALALGAAQDLHPGEGVAHRDGEEGIGLVVPVFDVEPGVELLDPRVFELEGLDLGADDGPVDALGGGEHRLGARMQAREVGEVGVEALPKALRLADIDDPALGVPEAVDARGLGDRPRLGAKTQGAVRGSCHTESLSGPADRIGRSSTP